MIFFEFILRRYRFLRFYRLRLHSVFSQCDAMRANAVVFFAVCIFHSHDSHDSHGSDQGPPCSLRSKCSGASNSFIPRRPCDFPAMFVRFDTSFALNMLKSALYQWDHWRNPVEVLPFQWLAMSGHCPQGHQTREFHVWHQEQSLVLGFGYLAPVNYATMWYNVCVCVLCLEFFQYVQHSNAQQSRHPRSIICTSLTLVLARSAPCALITDWSRFELSSTLVTFVTCQVLWSEACATSNTAEPYWYC